MTQEKKAPRWRKILLIVGIVLLVLLAAGFGGWQLLMQYFYRQYYQDAYQPLLISAEQIAPGPAEHHLDDVPWIASDIPACQSISLQMIAAQHGIVEPRRHFDFLMAFTYGASEIPGMVGFFPAGTDPEEGLRDAAPYLGLVRRYYTTDDPALYLQALRSYLAQGYPVRVALDMGALYGVEEFTAHSEVLVGYDAAGFFFYETVCWPPATCTPGERPAGEVGLYVPDERLLAAVENQRDQFSYPWRYSLTIFEPGPLVTDLGPVWTRLAEATLGGSAYGPRTGAAVIETVANQVEQQGPSFDVETTRLGLEAAVRFRRDNAQYLREAFPGEADLEQAAALFEQAAGHYQEALDAIADGIADSAEAARIATALRAAAAAERGVGAILEARGQ